MADAVDRLQAVSHADGVEPSPSPVREQPRVDLKMQVSVWVAGAGGEVTDLGGLELLDRHLHLPTARP